MDIDLRGFDNADRLLKQYSGDELNERLRPAMERSLILLAADMAEYPVQRPGSAYVRTGTLGRTWAHARPTVNRISGGLEGKIGNRAGYAPFVQNRHWQSRIHRMRWQTDMDVLEYNERRIRQEFEDALRR